MGNEGLKSLLSRFEFTSLHEGIRLTVQDYKANKHLYRHDVNTN